MANPKFEVTSEMCAEVERLAAKGANQDTIGPSYGLSGRGFRFVMVRNAELSAAYKRGKSTLDNKIIGKLVENCLKGEPSSIFFYLKTKCNFVENDKSKSMMRKIVEYVGSHPDLSDKDRAMLSEELQNVAEIDF